MPDYQGNSKKSKDPAVPKKAVEKVITGEVVVKKKSFGQKVKDVFIEADFRSVTHYVVTEVLVPAARNMIVDSATKGIERMMYGDRVRARGPSLGQSRMTYGGSPLMRTDYRHPSTRPPTQGPLFPRSGRNEFILPSREEASIVLQHMNDILEMYQVVSVADLHELMGLPTSFVDQQWGWFNLSGSVIRQIREGFLMEFPPVESIPS